MALEPRLEIATAEPLGCATEDLLVVHRMFRTLFGKSPAMVRSGRGASRKRLAAIDRNVREIVHGLHVHHHGEDIMLWERIEDRAPACALHVARMRAQHADIADRLDEVMDKLAGWQADRDGGLEPLAVALEAVRDTLELHLADEETNVRPVASQVIRQSEWDGLAEHGLAAIPPKRRLVQLGWILSGLDNDEDRREFWMKLPAPARAMYRIFGARKLRKEWMDLYHEPMPG